HCLCIHQRYPMGGPILGDVPNLEAARHERYSCPVPSDVRQRLVADLACLSPRVAKRWAVAGTGLPVDVRHFAVEPVCHGAARWLALCARRLRGVPDDAGQIATCLGSRSRTFISLVAVTCGFSVGAGPICARIRGGGLAWFFLRVDSR